MRVERFAAATVSEALGHLRTALGDDALVLRTKNVPGGVEIVATTSEELSRFRMAVKPEATPRTAGRRSRVIALVGPTGSGKTTTAAKLALLERAFGWGRVGLISLDTYKIGAYDQIQTYADVAGLPLEVLERPGDAAAALSRLQRCDVILVDTPGRAPNTTASEQAWRETLRALAPDETHLVLSAGVRLHVADAVMGHYADIAPTHLLLTKLDEVPDEAGVAQLADRVGLPARWVTDGQEVPDDLHGAPDRLVESALRGDAGDWMLGAAG
jgi:flagellar biosynthesis protein FlhF